MIRRLTEHGYLRVEQVGEAGEFAVRGAVLDVFPTGSPDPIRIDLFDDEIESLRVFDPQTQLSAGKIDSIRILPAREFPFDDAAIKAFRERFREQFPVDPSRCPVYRTISEAQLPAGIEYYLPLFFAATVSLFDYLGKDALVIVAEDALARLDESLGARRGALRAAARRHRAADPRSGERLLRAGRAARANRRAAHARAARARDAGRCFRASARVQRGAHASARERRRGHRRSNLSLARNRRRRAHAARDVVAGSSRDDARALAQPRPRSRHVRDLGRVPRRRRAARRRDRRARRRACGSRRARSA